MAQLPPPSSAEDAAQRRALQARVAAVCMVATAAVCAIDVAVWRTSGDLWKLAIAAFMGVLAALFGVSIVLLRRGHERGSQSSLFAASPIVIAWIMVTGGAATIIPTLIAALAMMLMLPDTVGPGIVAPRRWLLLLVAAYLGGIGLRLALRGLDFASSLAELAIIVIVPGALIFVQWMLIQRIFRRMRATLAESEALRQAHEDRNRELIASQQALERASGAKSQFLANMSHELRTPLNIILGYTEMIEEEIADDPSRIGSLGADLARIHAAGDHLLALIADILDLSKIEAGKTDISVDRFSLGALVREVADACTRLVQRQGNRLHLELDARADDLHTDRTKLRQILLNLLSNAAKFTTGGDIRVRTAVDGDDHVVVEVEDTGVGIDEEDHARIFDAFEQADSSSTRSRGGTGLGLTLVRRFADLLGGEVGLDSTPGVGSKFRVRLPRRPPAMPARS